MNRTTNNTARNRKGYVEVEVVVEVAEEVAVVVVEEEVW
jgi:hypothetical protein